MSESVEKQLEKVLTTDARTKLFKEKLKKLGYAKVEAKKVNKIMEKIGDFGMMSDAGNKKVARAVSQSKNEADLRKRQTKSQIWQGVNTPKHRMTMSSKELSKH